MDTAGKCSILFVNILVITFNNFVIFLSKVAGYSLSALFLELFQFTLTTIIS